MDRNRRGLAKLQPDLLSKAIDDTATQVNRILLTFVGTTIFCILSLLTPDSALLSSTSTLNVPLAGPVSFFGFIILGPTILLALRAYLQIYVEHRRRLDRLAKRIQAARAPSLIPLENPLIRISIGLAFYALLPLAMLMFVFKAAVFPKWGSGLLCVTAAVIAMHVVLPFRRLSWWQKGAFGVSAALLAVMVLVAVPIRRPFELTGANLSDQWLIHADLKDARLERANLARAVLIVADLRHANLEYADLRDAWLDHADLNNAALTYAKLGGAVFTGAFLGDAGLRGADLKDAKLNFAGLNGAHLQGSKLERADLEYANLKGADLQDASGLTQKQLDASCGDQETKLPPGLKPGTNCGSPFMQN